MNKDTPSINPAEYDRIKKEIEERNFFREMRVQLTEEMLWKEGQELGAWCDKVLEKLVPFVKGMQASIYYLDKKSSSLKLAGGYALPHASLVQKEIQLGENIIGEVARTMEHHYTEDMRGQDFLPFAANMSIKAKAILAAPLIYNQKTAGVLEILFFQPAPEACLTFLYETCDNIAASISSILYDRQLVESFDQIRESEERFKRLSEVTSEGIAFLDGLSIVEVNSVFMKMFGYEKEGNITGKVISEFIQNQKDVSMEDVAKILLDDKRSVETFGLRKDGSTFVMEVEAREMVYENQKIRVATFRDITEKRETEKALQESTQKLEEAEKVVQLHKDLKRKNKNITASINYAKRIQDAILPSIKDIKRQLPDSFVLHMVKDVVSGDFYWYQEKKDKIFIAAVDCTGHGVPGAFMSLLGSTILNQIVSENGVSNPRFILDLLDANIQQALKQDETHNKDGMDLALCVLDRKNKKMEFAGAKRPLVYIDNGNMTIIKGSKQAIGGATNKKAGQFEKAVIPLKAGTAFYIFSDGYQDQFSEDGQKFLIKRMRELFLEIHDEPMPNQKNAMEKTMLGWLGNKPLIDDILVIGFRLGEDFFA